MRSTGVGWRDSWAGERQNTTQQSASEYLAAFRALESEPAVSAYSAMEVVRSRAVVAVQVGEFTDAERAQMRNLLATFRSFVAAYEAADNGSRLRSLELANETVGSIDSLRDAGGQEYATLARLAVDQFYRTQGDVLRETARNTTRTPEQIRLFSAAVRAYRAGGATDRFSTTASNVERIRAEYRADLAAMNESAATTGAFLDGCADRCAGVVSALTAFGPGVFDRYVTARTAVRDGRRAVALADKHGLSDRSAQLESQLAASEAGLRGLTAASLAVLGCYTAVFALVAAVIMTRVSQWGADTAAASVGRIVPREPLEVVRE